MHVTTRLFSAGALALAFTTFVAVGPALAQAGEQAPPSSREQAQDTVQGELLKVDTTARTLTVKTSSEEMEFTFNDQTKISGAQRGVAGLATMTGSQVVVEYEKEGARNVARTIEIRDTKPSDAAPGPAPAPAPRE